MKILKTASYKKIVSDQGSGAFGLGFGGDVDGGISPSSPVDQFRDKFYPGDKVRISEGSGIDSGKIVIIVSRDNIQTDGRGVPTNVEGEYKPVDWNQQEAFQYADGTYGIMYKNRLEIFESKS